MAQTDFNERYEGALIAALEALDDIGPGLPEAVPGLSLSKVKRTLRSIGRLLKSIDSGEVRFPEFLATEDGPATEKVIEIVQQIPTIAASGAPHFASNSLAKLNDFQQRLAYSLGTNSRTVRDTRDRMLIELQATLDASQQTLKSIQTLRRKTGEELKKIDGAVERISTRKEQAETDVSTVKAIRDTAQKLSSGDARRGDSLEKLIRSARQKSGEFETLTKNIQQFSADASSAKEAAAKDEEAAKETLKRMADAETRANEILRGATQVGLAGAYKTERDRLFREQSIFAGVFYAINVAIVIYAVVWIVPVLTNAIKSGANGSTVLESALMLLVRTLILAPAIAALIFTSRRHSKLEMLQMDYAAKANTALAYSGYRDELGNDPALSSKLRDGLVVRFLEHPERLLSRSAATEEVDLTSDGVSYKSTSSSPAESED